MNMFVEEIRWATK